MGAARASSAESSASAAASSPSTGGRASASSPKPRVARAGAHLPVDSGEERLARAARLAAGQPREPAIARQRARGGKHGGERIRRAFVALHQIAGAAAQAARAAAP